MPLVNQAEADRLAQAQVFGGDVDVEIDDDYYEGDTDVESDDEPMDVKEAKKAAVKRRTDILFREREKNIRVVGHGNEATQLDTTVSDMIAKMNPADQEQASNMILEAVRQVKQATEAIAVPIDDPPLEIIIPTNNGKEVALTSQNALALRKDGKFVNPNFFNEVAAAVDRYDTTEENKRATQEWCMMVKGFYVMKMNLIQRTEEYIKTEAGAIKRVVKSEASMIIAEQREQFTQIVREYSNFIGMCNSNMSVVMRALGSIQGGLTDYSKFMSNGVMTLTKQHAESNQKLANIQGALQEIKQNNLGHQLQLYKGLESSFGALSNQLVVQKQDISTTKEQLNSIEKQIELLKNQEGALSQEQNSHVGELVSKMTSMMTDIKSILAAQGDINAIKQDMFDTLSAITTLNEAAEGIKTRTINERDFLVAIGSMLQQVSTVVPEIKSLVESVQDASATYGKQIIENQQQLMKAQFDSLKSISDSLVLFERSTVDQQKIQAGRHQELLKAIQDAASKQDIEGLRALVVADKSNEVKPFIDVEYITKMVLDIIQNGLKKYGEQMVSMVQGLIGNGSAPPALPSGENVPLLPAGENLPALPPGSVLPQIPPTGDVPILLPPPSGGDQLVKFNPNAPSFNRPSSRGVQKKTKVVPKKKSRYNVRITGPDGEPIENPLTDEAMEVEKNLPLAIVGGEPDPGAGDDDSLALPNLPLVPQGSRALRTKTKVAKRARNVAKMFSDLNNRALVVRKVGEMVLGRQRTSELMRAIVMKGGAMIGPMISRRAAQAIISLVPRISSISSVVMSILPAVRTIGGLLARYLGLYDKRSVQLGLQLSRQGGLLENAIARLTELKEVRDGDRFNQAPAVMTQLIDNVGTVQAIAVPSVMHYGKLERMTPVERVRTVMSLASRSSPISSRTHGIAVLRDNITDPALDNAADYKRATAKRRATRVKKIEHRRTNDPLNKFFQGNW